MKKKIKKIKQEKKKKKKKTPWFSLQGDYTRISRKEYITCRLCFRASRLGIRNLEGMSHFE